MSPPAHILCRKLAWITEKVNARYIVYLSTSMRSTKFTKKILSQIKATQSGLLIKSGKKLIDYSYTTIRATLR